MNPVWIAIAALAFTVIGSALAFSYRMGRYQGQVDARFVEQDKAIAVIHERKVALTRRIDVIESDVHEMRKEISAALKEGLQDIRSELTKLREEVAKKADRAN